tara:strand:+ start:684 stop:1325 length:642 start_codon:yes stop_codon:yes gene_type:complete
MIPIEYLKSFALPLERINIDTDQIIPKQYLKSIGKTGFGDYLFDNWRFQDEGEFGVTPNERTLNREFILNFPEYQGAEILLAGANFGCGSSREHAVWALMDYGFKCVISTSFADIFYNNSLKNGLLPVIVSEDILDNLFKRAISRPNSQIEVNLVDQTVIASGLDPIRFNIDPDRKNALMHGLDDISLTLDSSGAIRKFEASYFAQNPWLNRD